MLHKLLVGYQVRGEDFVVSPSSSSFSSSSSNHPGFTLLLHLMRDSKLLRKVCVCVRACVRSFVRVFMRVHAHVSELECDVHTYVHIHKRVSHSATLIHHTKSILPMQTHTYVPYSIPTFYPYLLSLPSIPTFYPYILSLHSIPAFYPYILSLHSIPTFYPCILSLLSIPIYSMYMSVCVSVCVRMYMFHIMCNLVHVSYTIIICCVCSSCLSSVAVQTFLMNRSRSWTVSGHS